MIPLCADQGVGLIPWSPLARGVLAGTRQAGTLRTRSDPFMTALYDRTQDADERVVERVARVAAARGAKPASVALAWLLHRPAMTAPIVGTSKPGHLADAVAAVGITLSQEEMSALEEPYVPHAVAGHV